ncbi:hypothetical protein Tco_1141379 [Tanacetum coccineum]
MNNQHLLHVWRGYLYIKPVTGHGLKLRAFHGISFVTEEEEEDSSKTLPCQLPPKEMNPGSFTLPCTIGNLKLYDMADLGAGVNVMPKSLVKHLKLADLKGVTPNMEVEMAAWTKKAPVERIDTLFNSCMQELKVVTDDESRKPSFRNELGPYNVSQLTSIKCEMFKEWIKENFNFEVDFGRTRDDPYSRRFDVYKEEFDNEIKQLENEYELKAGKKRYALDEVWEKCEKIHDTTKLC